MITIRNATPEDLPAIIQVEQSWPVDARAPEDKFLSRMQKFGQGFFLACLSDCGTPVATITTMPMTYRLEKMEAFCSWDEVTNRGYLHDSIPADCNALYIVSGVIDSRHRGANIFTPMVLREVALAQEMGLRYVLAGAVIPGYRKYCERHGEKSAFEYCTMRRGKHLVDPLLAMYESIGFTVRNDQHVLREYYPDDASRNYAALVVRDLEATPYTAS